MKDWLFYIAIALMPFENFFFAPSAGWAALSPLFFFAYAVTQREAFQVSFKRYFKIFIIVIVCMLLSCFDYLFVGIYVENVIDTVGVLALGLACLFSFDIFLNIKGNSPKKITQLLLVSYSIALVVGIVELLTLRFGIGSVMGALEALMKRYYFTRIQFMFTEPSFTSMHLFGVLLPFYMLTRDRRILILIMGFIAVSLMSASSLRLLVDTAVVILICFGNYADWQKVKTLFVAVLTPALVVILIFLGTQLNPRFQAFIDDGIQADASVASRNFRMEALSHGLINNPVRAVVGYGAGNAWAAIKDGYDDALLNYKNSYTSEVVSLGLSDNRPTSMFCMYGRIAGEFGLVVLLIVLAGFANLNKKVNSKDWRLILLVCAYLYIQFDGYGFYSVWILLALADSFMSRGSLPAHKADSNQTIWLKATMANLPSGENCLRNVSDARTKRRAEG